MRYRRGHYRVGVSDTRAHERLAGTQALEDPHDEGAAVTGAEEEHHVKEQEEEEEKEEAYV